MRKRIGIIAGIPCALLLLAFALYAAGYMPGTIQRLENGTMKGTGQWVHHYESGDVMLQEEYRAGTLRFSRWFRPDCSVIAETKWRNGTGRMYHLRQDGTIRATMERRRGKPHGQAIYYKEDGVTVDRIEEYREGSKVAGKP